MTEPSSINDDSFRWSYDAFEFSYYITWICIPVQINAITLKDVSVILGFLAQAEIILFCS